MGIFNSLSDVFFEAKYAVLKGRSQQCNRILEIFRKNNSKVVQVSGNFDFPWQYCAALHIDGSISVFVDESDLVLIEKMHAFVSQSDVDSAIGPYPVDIGLLESNVISILRDRFLRAPLTNTNLNRHALDVRKIKIDSDDPRFLTVRNMTYEKAFGKYNGFAMTSYALEDILGIVYRCKQSTAPSKPLYLVFKLIEIVGKRSNGIIDTIHIDNGYLSIVSQDESQFIKLSENMWNEILEFCDRL